MSQQFCLLDEPWMPVRLADGRVEKLGLLEVFTRSRSIVALAETEPPSLVAQYRLLLAITHRALVTARREWKESDRVRWFREGLPLEAVVSYLEQWREAFWLFHPDRPFLQVAKLADAEETRDKLKPWTQISLASSSGNMAVVFDHATDGDPKSLQPESAVTTLLGFLQFTPGGLVKVLRDADKGGALLNTAAVVPVGTTLAETLVLCLHPSPTAHAEPDLPAWEREPLSIRDLRGEPVLASGPNDRYTRQTRAVLLRLDQDGCVRRLHFAAGLALAEDPNAPDPMASFRTGSSGLVRLTFGEARATWRDLPALVPNPSGASQAAAVLNHAIALRRQLLPFESVYQPLLVAGLASDQAKLLRWRADQIVLPAELLLDAEKGLSLSARVQASEALFAELRTLATRMQAETLPDASSKDTRTRARSLIDAGPLASAYFSPLERSLPDLMACLANDRMDEAEAYWCAALRSAATSAWERLLEGMGGSSLAIRADALFWPRFQRLLSAHIPKKPTTAAEEARCERTRRRICSVPSNTEGT